jgi:hypothetical protein
MFAPKTATQGDGRRTLTSGDKQRILGLIFFVSIVFVYAVVMAFEDHALFGYSGKKDERSVSLSFFFVLV